MEQRVDLMTIRTDDVAGAAALYRRLGWRPLLDVEGEIAFFQVGHGRVIGFFEATQFDRDLGETGHSFTLAHNVGSEDEVRQAVQELREAGASVMKEPQRADFGGFHAYVEDAAGVAWEICHNPGWTVAPDGAVDLRPIE